MKYILMHRELPVAVLSIDDISDTVYRVDDVLQPAHLPIGLYTTDRKELAKNLNFWLAGRTIPASRSGFHRALEDLQVQKKLQLSASALMMKCFALSLSDQYWLNPAEQSLEWSKVNFYHNDFSEDVGNILFGQIPQQDSIDLVSPCNTSDGWLKKKWKILNGQRVLVKGGSGMAQQEPFNEVVASLLCRKLKIPHVEYSLLFEGNKPYSVCPNMTTDRQDFVSAYYIFSAFPRTDGVSAYEHFLSCCEKLGIPNVPKQLQQMMILDYLICNQDRHFGNFGAIRNAVTLEWVGFAPIFDSGTSLWFDQYASKIDALADAPVKPFAATQQAQLALAKDGLHTLNLAALDDCKEEVLAIFEQAHFGEPNRARVLVDALAARCETLQKSNNFEIKAAFSYAFLEAQGKGCFCYSAHAVRKIFSKAFL